MSTTTAGQIASVTVDVGGQEIVFETGKLAKQANGAVVVRSGETMILATAVGRPNARPDADFFPLTVDVEEKMYAAGKIPGGFFKREGRATERATLTARMIDRPIRPLWPKGFRNEVQVICTVLGRPRHAARHSVHQRRVGGAHDLAAAVPRTNRRRAGRPRRRRVRPQSDSRAARGVDARPHRRRHERRADDGRGRWRPDPRGHDSRALGLAHNEVRKICTALEGLRAEVGKPKWVDVDLTAELDAAHGDAVRSAIADAWPQGGRRRRRGR